jgi:nucleotide-binding universal stress UspA family protein
VSGPAVIGYDGSPSAERAVHAATILASAKVLIVAVWEPGLALDLMTPSIEPIPIDLPAALELDEAMYERARQIASVGASIARDAGLDAQELAVADELTVAQTLARLAGKYDALAIVVGSHGHGGLRALLGSTSQHLLKEAPCPVVVARAITTTDDSRDA